MFALWSQFGLRKFALRNFDHQNVMKRALIERSEFARFSFEG